MDEWSNKKLEKSSNDGGKSKNVLPVAMGGIKEVSCYGCGIAGHKKGDPSCKAGKFDAHASAPKDYKERMAKKRKFNSEIVGKQGGKQPGKPGKKGEAKGEKKPCRAFNFGKGTCRYGAKCHFLHDKGQGEGKVPGFSPQQEKMVNAMVASAIKKTAKHIAKKAKTRKAKVTKSKEDEASGDDEDYASMLAACMLAPIRNTIKRDYKITESNTVMVADLHSVEKNCGIDSDAGISISTLAEDFLWIDESEEAKNSIQSPAGINGGTSSIGGRGPMCVRAITGEYLIDPDAVYLKGGGEQPNFRVLSTQRLKMNGVRIVGCFKGTEIDVLQDRVTKKTIHLAEEGPKDKKILVVNTVKCPVFPCKAEIKQIVDDIRKRNRSAMVNDMVDSSLEDSITNDESMEVILEACRKNEFSNSVMAFNVAKLTDEERSRLMCRRLGYCNTAILPRLYSDSDNGEMLKLVALNEENSIMDQAKFKKKAHGRTDPELSQGRPPWFRVYVDGAGGGKSMGCESYEGAIGSYLFVCSSTGEVVHKLYASHEQFPAALFQFLVHVEAEGNRCHEVYCDTFSANISGEVEEVAALFQVKIVPVSSGTPQEVSFVETANRVVAARSRAMLLGAPHLPKWCWALSTAYSCYVGRLLPQSTRGWKCSYFLNTLKAPDWRHMFVHVFGAPCMYSPPEGPVHKRAEQTLEGFFVGIQHPMALVIRKSDMKLISVSKKKLVVYESMYTVPLTYSSAKLREKIDEIGVPTHTDEEAENAGRKHVQSIKSVSSQNLPIPNTRAHLSMRPPTTLDASADTQSPSLGEGLVVPEHNSYSEDLAEGILALKRKAESTINDPTIRRKVVDSITNLLDESTNVVPRNQLKTGKQSKGNVNVANVIEGKRMRVKEGENVAARKRAIEKQADDVEGLEPPKKKVKEKTLLPKFGIKRGDAVSVSSKVFDGNNPGSFSKSNPERQHGTVARVWAGRKIAQVEYEDGSKWMHRYGQLRI